ncbi:MAG: glycoside hydrolase family 3 N-terminal domain-containing protein [Chloroflexota bacterium]|nr:glycoside hydrolase family 3 N-terminal domain-containing protein [Chloroflexota bacterium]
MVRLGRLILRAFFILVLIFTSLTLTPVSAINQPDAQELLQSMSAEEKIGQLFLVTFEGTNVGEESEIYNLIAKHHIGGVVLLAENNNFTSEDIISRTQEAIIDLQRIEWNASTKGNNAGSSESESSYVPLLVGLKQLGNGFPSDQILSGLTSLPSQMAIGASWDLNLADQAGQVLGRELTSLGINLYLGPNLDVLETANNEAASSLGVNTYGGDPFWVGEIGKSFIKGLHTGSENRILVVAQNFPGTGNSDRSPESEVATVRKSLEQLKQIELAPYFTVTTPELGDAGRVDAVMVSHIRYQGFQGNIRATTRPISFDSNALQQIMSLEQFAAWRDTGGLLISEDLGSGAIRRFFDPNETNFDARQVALNAFLAGNDVLYVDDLITTGDPDAYTTLLSTLEFFVQKYREDSAFAKRVDASVLRILQAKTTLYNNFDIQNIIPSSDVLETVGQSQEVTFDVAQSAVTLINPSRQEIDSVLPSPPLSYEDIVIFTDIRQVYQCDECPPFNDVSANTLASELLDLYGPQAGGQIQDYRLTSYSFKQLVSFLDNLEGDSSETILTNLDAAEWVVFNTLELDPAYPESTALQRVLSERSDLLAGKRVIVFAMGAPTYLDATNISKVTAYYALYSKAPSSLEVAARVLMKELDPPGALPVSLNAVGYDLISVMAPDPNQVIPLSLVLPEEEEIETEEEAPSVTQTPEPTPIPSFTVGDTLMIRAGQIFDHNQNVVPDGTIVRFNFLISGEPGITQQFETTTQAGVAYFTYRMEAAGGLQISATSEPAIQSEILQINISPDGSTSVIAYTPTPLITPTSTEMPSATPTGIPTPTITPTPFHNDYPTLGDWALGVIVIALGSGLAFLIGYFWWGSFHWGLRSSMCTMIGGLLAYIYLNLGVQGTKIWMEKSGMSFVIEVIIVGLLLGWIVGLIWWMRTAGRYFSRNHRKL